MAINKQDIAELTTEELNEKLAAEKVRYRKLQFNHTVSPLDNPLMLRGVRRDIARLETELKARHLNALKEEASKKEEANN